MQSPENHLLGKKCELRWDTKKFIYFSRKIHGYKYDYSLVKFINMYTSVDIILNGIIFKQTPSKHLMGREIEKGLIVKTTNDFIEDSKKIWGNKYDYSLVDYKGSHIPVNIIYNNIIYKQTPSSHINKMNCERNVIKSQEDFLKKAMKKHGSEKYDYSLVEYTGIENKIKIIYNGEIYEQKAGAHLYAGLVENNKFRKTTEEFIEKSNLVHSNNYNYSKTNYINNTIKVIIICKIHGEFLQNPSSHLKGIGCAHCKESKGEKKINNILKSYNIIFERQKRFENCRGIKKQLPFDFYISSLNTIIEFDGKQHYEPNEHFGGVEAFEQLKINDKIKNDYCKDNFINLIRIPYYEFNNIEKFLVTLTEH